MGFKMKGSTFYGSPLNSGKGKKTIASEDTDIIKTDKKGKDYSLAMYDNDKGVNRGDTLFVDNNNPKVRQTTAGRNSSDYIRTIIELTNIFSRKVLINLLQITSEIIVAISILLFLLIIFLPIFNILKYFF